MTTIMMLSLFLLFSLLAVSIGVDQDDQMSRACNELVEQGMCRTDPKFMSQFCQEPCAKWLESVKSVETRHVKDGDPSFFDLEAKDVFGSTLNFDRFEGYVTIVSNFPKACVEGVTEKGLSMYENLQKIWPYTLEFVVFPFEHPDISYVHIQDCESHTLAVNKKGRKIHVMEEVKINGPDTHPVLKYLKGLFDLEDLQTNHSTFFLISPDGDSIEVHHGATLPHLKSYIRQHLDQDL